MKLYQFSTLQLAGGIVLAILLCACTHYTGDPNEVTAENGYVYDVRLAKRTNSRLASNIEKEKKNGAKLAVSAEVLRQKLALLRPERERESKTITSSSTTAEAKKRAEKRKQELDAQIHDLEDSLSTLVLKI